jgi:GntR family transcriptional repressor for pyruvate dehydrogenase complex
MATTVEPRTHRMRRQVVERISSALRREIVKGRFRPGDPLPSERDLAQRYEVNRSSIREAMKRLEAWGLVNIRHGGATRVADFLLSAGGDWLPRLVELGSRVDPAILQDLHEFRGILLGWCAERAAQKADPAAVVRLSALADHLAHAAPPVAQELDYDFFQELVAITGNRLLALFSNVVRDVYSRGSARFLSLYTADALDTRLHRAAVEAIGRGDSKAAGEAMRAHAANGARAALEER